MLLLTSLLIISSLFLMRGSYNTFISGFRFITSSQKHLSRILLLEGFQSQWSSVYFLLRDYSYLLQMFGISCKHQRILEDNLFRLAINNVSCQNGLEKVNFWHFFFHLKVEMSSFGRILLKIIFFIENVTKNNICFQKLSFEAFKNHVYKF